MATTPRISVIMPVFNGAAFVARALSSVFAQTISDFELIVVDDASTDDLAAALAPFEDARLRLIRHPVNKGAAASRNTALEETRGDTVAFIDADDEWLPDKLERQLALLDASPREVAVSITGYYLVRDRLGRREQRRLPACDDWYMRLLSGCTVSFGSCALVRRQAFTEIGGFDINMRRLEDWDWLLRYTAKYPIANLEEPLAIVHSGLGWPTIEAVERATQQILERHEKNALARSAQAQRLLLSTVYYERAAALYHHRRVLTSIPPALRSHVLYPKRNRDFYRHLLRRGGDVLHGSVG